MRINTFLVPLLAGTIFLTACNKNAVVLSYTNAKDEVPQLGNLVFRFNKSLAKDTMLNNWDSTEYISFEPRIAGRFRWESPDQLVFSPLEPLAPATNYKAKVRDAVLHFSKYDKVTGAEKISFHTPALTLDNSQFTWVGESGTTAIPQLDLYFNYRVNPEDLADKLEIQLDGKKAAFSALTQSTDNKISFAGINFLFINNIT